MFIDTYTQTYTQHLVTHGLESTDLLSFNGLQSQTDYVLQPEGEIAVTAFRGRPNRLP